MVAQSDGHLGADSRHHAPRRILRMSEQELAVLVTRDAMIGGRASKRLGRHDDADVTARLPILVTDDAPVDSCCEV